MASKIIAPKLLGLTMSNEDYHADTSRISKSGLDCINKSPAHYYERYLRKKDESEFEEEPEEEKPKVWAVTGNAVGAAILEPDDFKNRYTQINDTRICELIGGAKPRSTNKYKEWYAEEEAKLAGKIILRADKFDECLRMRDAVHVNHSMASKILNPKDGQAERTFYFTDPVTGVSCRIRPDWLNSYLEYIVDVKTCADASAEGFGRSAYKYRYHVQDSFYTDGMTHNGFTPKGFMFIAIEKKRPHNVGVYVVPIEVRKLGREEYSRNLVAFRECTVNNQWPGYNDGLITPLNFPAYAFTKTRE